MSTTTPHLAINSNTIIKVLSIITCVLILISIGGQWWKFTYGDHHVKALIQFFNLDHERNIPTFFSVFLLFFVAVLLSFIAKFNYAHMQPHTSKWVILACGFVFMAFDEAFQIHERFIWPFRALLGENNLGIFYFAWVIPGIFLILILALYFFKFLIDLPKTARIRFLIAATLYISGAIGFEFIGGYHVEKYGEDNLTYSIITTIEESLELSGLVFFIWALLKYCEQHYKSVLFVFE